ncbi:DUF5131 family protein [Shimia sagamensis]|uniref:Protein gp37 n=1 Tax=Shimia sagamensis TaxID=1566352 RepID=A0ABY1PH92_9RHOB|nr:phage Gp37/Gp68 family protein [Shimia sagamensis]SMP31994.1 protein gp37 [Shimia sagamensis]
MAENSGIEWTTHTFNPWIGCTKVSPACDHCYAEVQTARFKQVEWGPHAPRKRTSEGYWKTPLKWNRQAEGATDRPRVFCASLADVFDNHKSIQQSWRDDLWQLIKDTPNLDWLLLTKRPQNLYRFLPQDWSDHGWGYANVWLGTTVESQAEANRRIPELLEHNARQHFLSCEPLLAPIDLTTIPYNGNNYFLDALRGKVWMPEGSNDLTPGHLHNGREYVMLRRSVTWVIAGGESGAMHRKADPEWFRSLRDQCLETQTPFHFKQWEGRNQKEIKALGRKLDGVVHDGYPT